MKIMSMTILFLLLGALIITGFLSLSVIFLFCCMTHLSDTEKQLEDEEQLEYIRVHCRGC